jgi:hypothetical protein
MRPSDLNRAQPGSEAAARAGIGCQPPLIVRIRLIAHGAGVAGRLPAPPSTLIVRCCQVPRSCYPIPHGVCAAATSSGPNPDRKAPCGSESGANRHNSCGPARYGQRPGPVTRLRMSPTTLPVRFCRVGSPVPRSPPLQPGMPHADAVRPSTRARSSIHRGYPWAVGSPTAVCRTWGPGHVGRARRRQVGQEEPAHVGVSARRAAGIVMAPLRRIRPGGSAPPAARRAARRRGRRDRASVDRGWPQRPSRARGRPRPAAGP